MSFTSRMISLNENPDGGGFVRRKHLGGDKYKRKASSHKAVVDPADLNAARERWAGSTPLAVAREIAADLPDELAASLVAQLGPLEASIQETVVGELVELEAADLNTAIASGVLATRIAELVSEASEAAAVA